MAWLILFLSLMSLLHFFGARGSQCRSYVKNYHVNFSCSTFFAFGHTISSSCLAARSIDYSNSGRYHSKRGGWLHFPIFLSQAICSRALYVHLISYIMFQAMLLCLVSSQSLAVKQIPSILTTIFSSIKIQKINAGLLSCLLIAESRRAL